MNLNDLALPVGLIAFAVLAVLGLVLIVAHHMTPRGDHHADDGPWPPETPPAYPPPPHPDGGTQ